MKMKKEEIDVGQENQREAGKCLVVCYGTDNALLSGALLQRWMQSAHTDGNKDLTQSLE